MLSCFFSFSLNLIAACNLGEQDDRSDHFLALFTRFGYQEASL